VELRPAAGAAAAPKSSAPEGPQVRGRAGLGGRKCLEGANGIYDTSYRQRTISEYYRQLLRQSAISADCRSHINSYQSTMTHDPMLAYNA